MSERMTQEVTPARILDIRTYRTVASERGEFLRIMRDDAVPMLRRYGIDVVAFGPSLHDADHSFLIRSFASSGERDEQLGRFYGSEEWLGTYDDRVTALLETYLVVVVEAAPEVVSALRTLVATAG
jgi:hypothetical protein